MQKINLEQALTQPKYLSAFLIGGVILAELICLSLAGSLTYLFKYGLTFQKPALVYYILSAVFISVYAAWVINMLSYTIKRAWLITLGRALVYFLVLLVSLALICLIGLVLGLVIWFALSSIAPFALPVPSLDNGLFSSSLDTLWLAGVILFPYIILTILFFLVKKIYQLV